MKKMSFCLAIVLLLSFCFGGCGQPQPNPKLDDLNLLCETLETEHYDLYANISEEEFQAEREKIAKQTPNMTDAEFYWSVRHLLSLVGDAHTTAYPSDYFMSVLPWNIKKFDEGWFILILDKAGGRHQRSPHRRSGGAHPAGRLLRGRHLAVAEGTGCAGLERGAGISGHRGAR